MRFIAKYYPEIIGHSLSQSQIFRVLKLIIKSNLEHRFMKKQRQNWNSQEDEKLIELQLNYGSQWRKIAELMRFQLSPGKKYRTACACRERYENILKPSLNKEKWTSEEESLLFKLQETYGNCWIQIAEHMVGRSELICKNYFYATLRRVLRRLSKSVGVKTSSQFLNSIKPSVLMDIYLEPSPCHSSLLKKTTQEELKEMLAKYRQIGKEEIAKLSSAEIQNIKSCFEELIEAKYFIHYPLSDRYKQSKEANRNELKIKKNEWNKSQIKNNTENILKKRLKLNKTIFKVMDKQTIHEDNKEVSIEKNLHEINQTTEIQKDNSQSQIMHNSFGSFNQQLLCSNYAYQYFLANLYSYQQFNYCFQ